MSDRFDDEIRPALYADAEGVTADHELLDRIRAASTKRPTRHQRARWLVVAAAVATTAGVGAVLLIRSDSPQTVDAVDDQATATTTGGIVPDEDDLAALGGWCGLAPGIDIVLVMDDDAPAEALDTMQARLELEGDDRIRAVRFVDKEESFELFTQNFADQPDLIATVTPDIAPTGYLIDLVDRRDSDVVADELRPTRGVSQALQQACPDTAIPTDAERPAQVVAVTEEGRLVLLRTDDGAEVRELADFGSGEVTEDDVAPTSITGVALRPNTNEVYFETCCEPAAGQIYLIDLDMPGSEPDPVAYGFGIDISADGRWLAFASIVGPVLRDLETGEEVCSAQSGGASDNFTQVAVNHDGSEVTVERALDYSDDPVFRVVRSELITFHRDGDALVQGETTGGDIRLLPIYSAGGTELTTLPARNGVLDLNVDSSGRWFLATPSDRPLRGYTEAADEQEIPGGPYLAADW